MNIENKVILITGASSGIGEATAYKLAQHNSKLILVARRKNELERVQNNILKQYGLVVLIVNADITKKKDQIRVFQKVKQKYGQLDILINNAGITAHGRFDQTDVSVLRKTMELNFFAAVELTASLLPLMKKSSGNKSIVLISTPSGLYGIPGRFAYSASKAAGHAWMESMRQELKQEKFYCSIICPGYTKTALRHSGFNPDGSIMQEEQARGANSAEFMANYILRAIQKNKRLQLTDINGRFVYWLRVIAPSLLEKIMSKKLAKDIQA